MSTISKKNTPLDQWGVRARLPEELAELLDPSTPLHASIAFFQEKPQPGLFGAIALPFSTLFFLLALGIGPLRLFFAGTATDTANVLGSVMFSMLLTALGVLLILKWRAEARDALLQRSGRWRRGVFLTPTHLVVNFGPKDVIALRRDDITSARFSNGLDDDDDGADSPYLSIRHRRAGKENLATLTLRQVTEPELPTLAEAISRWQLNES